MVEEVVDAIVVPSNEWLVSDKKIMERAGPGVQKEADAFIKKKGKVPVGQAVITKSGNINCKYLIHAVLP